ncbi:SubName: Full=Uncharacterized protein {ECO:0000313/EMBL:CCA74501.1} [Serendipita indica DSM 11827]|nr:SubName: Full=Uncharacterized protein {ECO:0000313/EMBL:CCA74501.1} [Serendipita indica DSM 11827]
MPSDAKPQSNNVKNTQSFFAGLLRKKRLLGTVTLVGISLFLLNQFTSGSVTSWFNTTSKPQKFDEFQGMLYYLTKSTELLPAKMNGSEWEARLTAMRAQYPVIVFSKTYCPYSKKAKAILAEYALKKQPVFIEADLRPDMAKIKALLRRLTGQDTFPNVVVNGKSLGGADRLTVLHESGKLKKKLKAAGAL